MLVYLCRRILFYLKSFLFTYYFGGTNFFWRFYLNIFYSLEKKLGVLVNIRYFLVPIWQEYSFAGYLISIPIRVLKILLGGIALLFVSCLWLVLYASWCLLPVYLLWRVFSS